MYAYPIFDDLVKRHSEPHRHYHTLEHVAEVLRIAGRLSKYAAEPNAVMLAAWFHDVVYDPRMKTMNRRVPTSRFERWRMQ
jgi:predicted metal-dependent HD superfamily phosphohydrolase